MKIFLLIMILSLFCFNSSAEPGGVIAPIVSILLDDQSDNVPYKGLAVKVAASHSGHTCALLSDGRVKCWGFNEFGQLGTGTTMSSDVPLSVLGVASAVDISVGGSHSCALLASGRVRCWGRNSSGQLGSPLGDSSKPVDVLGFDNAVQLSGSRHSNCVALGDGRVKCWGSNFHGQLGDQTQDNSASPVDVIGISSAISVASYNSSTCALLDNQSIKCWGANGFGDLGDGTRASSLEPVSVLGINDAVAISTTGSGSACAITTAGKFMCWGSNSYGRLGDGTRELWSTPVEVTGIENALVVSSADAYFTCGVLTTGEAKCWGRNSRGTLGDGTNQLSELPVSVLGITSATDISTGSDHACAVLQNGSVQCWGYNSKGRLGTGDRVSTNRPKSVVGF